MTGPTSEKKASSYTSSNFVGESQQKRRSELKEKVGTNLLLGGCERDPLDKEGGGRVLDLGLLGGFPGSMLLSTLILADNLRGSVIQGEEKDPDGEA